jgi:dephospho-CoA kinase
MKIIAFTGMPFSGKTEAVKIGIKMNIPIIRMGDFVWEEVKKRGLKLNDKNVGFVANEMRKKHEKEIWAIKTVEKIKKENKKTIILIDGIRSCEEVNYFKRVLENDFILIAIISSDELRYKRALYRKRKDDCEKLEKIKNRDIREISWGIDSVIDSSNHNVLNDSSIEELHKKIIRIIKKYEKP